VPAEQLYGDEKPKITDDASSTEETIVREHNKSDHMSCEQITKSTTNQSSVVRMKGITFGDKVEICRTRKDLKV
jgi:hypothetical protein